MVSMLLAFSTNEIAREQTPTFIIHKFQRSTCNLATVLQNLADRGILQRPGSDELLESRDLFLNPRPCFFRNGKTLQIFRKIFGDNAANPALTIWIFFDCFRITRNAFVNSSNHAIEWGRKFYFAITLPDSKQRFPMADFLTYSRE